MANRLSPESAASEPARPEPARPEPLRPISERLLAWIGWFGIGRLVVTSLSIVCVGVGGYLLTRASPPRVEDALPRAPGTSITNPVRSEIATDTQPWTTTAQEPIAVTVHVAGAVVVPGVYRLPGGARVVEAVALAGGARSDADTDAINLAAVIVDGQQVYVPIEGERVPGGATSGTPGATGASAGPINLNSASVEQLDTLPGVGPATAAAIVAHRDSNGPFASVDSLADVRGIGPAKLDALRGLVTV